MPKKVPDFRAEKDPQRKWHLALAGEKNASNGLFHAIWMILTCRKAQNFGALKFDHFDALFDDYDRTHRQPLSNKTRKFWNTYAGTQGEDICIALMKAIENEDSEAIRFIATTLEEVIALQKRPIIDQYRERIASISAAEDGKPFDDRTVRELLSGEFPGFDPAHHGRVVEKMGVARVKHPIGRTPKKRQNTPKKSQ